MIEGAGGTDWFDVVNYHYYSPWYEYSEERVELMEVMEELGIEDKEVWLTETGSTSSEELNTRTNYPNSEVTQAADVWRRIISAYGHGDELVLWHSYIGGADNPGNAWRQYGLRESDSTPKLAYYSFKLLAEEIIPFESVKSLILEKGREGLNVFEVVMQSEK